MESKYSHSVVSPNGNNKSSGNEPGPDYIEGEDGGTIPLTFRTTLFKHGEERAMRSMALKPDEKDLQALDEHAEAMAEEAARNVFDPEKHFADKLSLQEYERDQNRREVLQQRADEANRQFHARQHELAVIGNLEPAPAAVSISTKLLLALLVGATIVLTFHDFIFTFDDQIVNWLVSSVTAFFIGLAVVWVEVQNFD